ncbi:MAG: putative nucleotide-diphospho-sugar transferase, partial [Bradyrhizobium sp.]
MKTKIVCFINGSYLRIALNWLRGIEEIGISEFATIVTMDLKSRLVFATKKVRTMHRPMPSWRLDDLWRHRTLVIAEILEDGFDVIHSDADAVWLRNPLPLIFDGNEDLVFSQGTIWPQESLEKRGFVLCCGLFAARSNDRTKRFFGDLIGRLRCDPDDQRVLNLLVDERFPDWEIDRPYKHSF